jgi:hypothetical protein
MAWQTLRLICEDGLWLLNAEYFIVKTEGRGSGWNDWKGNEGMGARGAVNVHSLKTNVKLPNSLIPIDPSSHALHKDLHSFSRKETRNTSSKQLFSILRRYTIQTWLHPFLFSDLSS